MTVGRMLKGVRAGDLTSAASALKPYTSGKLFISQDDRELVAIFDEPPAATGQVVAAWRRLYLPTGQISPVQLLAELDQKYGARQAFRFGGDQVVSWGHAPDEDRCLAYRHGSYWAFGHYWLEDDVRTRWRAPNAAIITNTVALEVSSRAARTTQPCGPVVSAAIDVNEGTVPMDRIEVTLTDPTDYARLLAASLATLAKSPAAPTGLKF